jgi:hypothetical protein
MEANLAERLLLLAYKDDGTPEGDADAVDYGLAGAVLMDLMLAGRVDLAESRVVVTDAAPTGDPVLDEVLTKIAAAAKPAPPQDWVQELTLLRERLLGRLVERGVLRRERDKVLLVFPRTRYPASTGGEPAVETETRRELQSAVDGAGPVDPRTAALCALVRAAGLDGVVFPGRPSEQLRERLAAIASTAWPDRAVGQALKELEEAIIQMVITSTSVHMVLRGGDG